jgi:oligosaccharide reducing-end xylanase
MDCHRFAKDKGQQELTHRIQAFFFSEDIATHRQLYTQDGKPYGGPDGKWHSIGLAATNGATSLASADKLGWQFVDAVWGTPTPTGTWRYYDGMLLMFSLLHLSGNYKIYKPGDGQDR